MLSDLDSFVVKLVLVLLCSFQITATWTQLLSPLSSAMISPEIALPCHVCMSCHVCVSGRAVVPWLEWDSQCHGWNDRRPWHTSQQQHARHGQAASMHAATGLPFFKIMDTKTYRPEQFALIIPILHSEFWNIIEKLLLIHFTSNYK